MSKTNHLSGKEVRAIAKENKKVIKKLEAYKNRKAPESEYLNEIINNPTQERTIQFLSRFN